ncbi:MAG: NfeD family protein [bacterium]|nr:NfeD family protein [bacterium]
MRTVLFYSLLQIPGIAILGVALTAAVQFGWLSVSVAAGIGVAWLIKDIAMYPFVKSAYARRDSDDRGPNGLVGANATVTRELAPIGFVRIKGELWQAECVPQDGTSPESAAPVPVNARVEVVAARGMLLLVRSCSE